MIVSSSLLAVAIILGLFSAGHAVVYKRDPRSAFGWMTICLFAPIVGATFYWMFGVNRVEKKGEQLRPPVMPDNSDLADPITVSEWPAEHISFARFSRKVTHRQLEPGNSMKMLINGEEAFPEMLSAIESARESIALCTYIFDSDEIGTQFVDALAAATTRGLQVCVLVDSVGEMYSRPRISRLLQKRGVRAARFLPWSLRPFNLGVNLRNHRKVMIVDGRIAYTGGMNISARHLAKQNHNPRQALDLHFRLEGPVVADIEQIFMQDWFFSTGEDLLTDYSSRCGVAGDSYCRVLVDGPSRDLDILRWMYLGAINAARHSVKIMTPYFIPERELIAVLGAAAMRGVRVQILLPEKTNISIINWAMRSMLWQVLETGVEVYVQPEPFRHTKAFVIDDNYAIVGSANFDVRSFRLNFELNVDVYSAAFVRSLDEYFNEALSQARRLTLEEVDSRKLAVRFRDGMARLFSPYL